MQTNNLIKSPLNYTGGKYKLLKQLLPLFPDNVTRFVDLFCGGCDIAANVTAKKIFANDIDRSVVGIMKTFQLVDEDSLFKMLYDTIDKYGLSDITANGYSFYGCDSNKGLGPYNKQGYEALRKYVNGLGKSSVEYHLLLFLLIVFSFNNQIRFNKKGEFNMPVGKRDFNSNMREKLKKFIKSLKEKSIVFTNYDFRRLDTNRLTDNDFVYCDPPYLITCATYNEQGGWSEKDETELYQKLDGLDERGVKFCVSNVLSNKGKVNTILKEWSEKYTVVRLTNSYSNCSYHALDKSTDSTEEVAVFNYVPKSISTKI